jgi:3',5'-cyclic AMP phosphodiesterase CpdA
MGRESLVRTAIISDIHGNLTAVEAVLADLLITTPDLILHGGDLADSGSSPVEVIDIIRSFGWRGVVGNTDEMLSTPSAFEEFASLRRGFIRIILIKTGRCSCSNSSPTRTRGPGLAHRACGARSEFQGARNSRNESGGSFIVGATKAFGLTGAALVDSTVLKGHPADTGSRGSGVRGRRRRVLKTERRGDSPVRAAWTLSAQRNYV